MRMINQSKVDKGIMLKMESMHFIKDTLIHNYNERIIPEILYLNIRDTTIEDTDSEKTDFEEWNHENNFEYTDSDREHIVHYLPR